MYNPAHFPGPLVCRIIQVLLYIKTNSKIWFEPVNSIFEIEIYDDVVQSPYKATPAHALISYQIRFLYTKLVNYY